MNAMVSGFDVETIEVDQESGTVRTQFDQEKTSASMAVIATLADVTDADPVELDPLHSTLDPDALDALVSVRTETDGDIHVSFTHEDHEITVYSYGMVTVSQENEPPAEKNERDTER